MGSLVVAAVEHAAYYMDYQIVVTVRPILPIIITNLLSPSDAFRLRFYNIGFATYVLKSTLQPPIYLRTGSDA